MFRPVRCFILKLYFDLIGATDGSGFFTRLTPTALVFPSSHPGLLDDREGPHKTWVASRRRVAHTASSQWSAHHLPLGSQPHKSNGGKPTILFRRRLVHS